MEIRHNPITGDPVICAPERSARPNAFAPARTVVQRVRRDPGCPFCPGNESETPPEVVRAGDPWHVRVFPNKYPFAPAHEVIVEAAEHDAAFEELPHAGEVVSVALDRHRALSSRDGIRSTILFKNHGPVAGASLGHLHSQIAGLSFVPPRIAREADAFRQAGSCPLCALDSIGKVVAERETFSAFAPHARQFSNELWLVPRSHRNGFGTLSDAETSDLAVLLQVTTARMTSLSSSYNWCFIDFGGEPRAHAYVEVVPRSSSIAGFEIAAGTFIDSGSGER